MLIDRADRLINLCECKFCSSGFTVDKEYDRKLRERQSTFAKQKKVTIFAKKGGKSEICVDCSISVGESSFFSFIHGAGCQFVPSKPDFLNIKRDAVLHCLGIDDDVLPTAVFLGGDRLVIRHDVRDKHLS